MKPQYEQIKPLNALSRFSHSPLKSPEMKLNYFPIQIDFEQFQISTEPYTVERLAELRAKHNETHSFFKNGERIYIFNKEGDDNLVIGQPEEVKTFAQHEISSSLIKHLFFRTFKDRFPTRIPIDFYPFRFFSGQLKDDIL